MLESELGGVNKTMKSLSVQGGFLHFFSAIENSYWCRIFISFTFAGDENGKREEDLEEEIKDVKERFRDAEVRTASASIIEDAEL